MNVEILPKSVDFLPKEGAMHDVDVAASLLDEVIGSRGVREPVKCMLERAYSLLSKRNSVWTRRRVRAVFHKEASRIEHREIEDLRAILEAREKHAAYREETARLTQMAIIQAQKCNGDMVS